MIKKHDMIILQRLLELGYEKKVLDINLFGKLLVLYIEKKDVEVFTEGLQLNSFDKYPILQS